MRRVLVIAGVALIAILLMGSEGCEGQGAPTDDLQERWANAACEPHGGIETLDHYDGEESPANVTCRDGSLFTQRHNPDSEWEWERPIEVREREL